MAGSKTSKGANTLAARLAKKKAKFIEVITAKNGNISEACKASSMSRQTYYDWVDADPEFKAQVDDAAESLIDMSESQLIEAVKQGNIVAILFHLKTKGKSRGYIEKSEQDINVSKVEGLTEALDRLDGKDTGIPAK